MINAQHQYDEGNMRKPTFDEISSFNEYRANHVALVQKLGRAALDMDFSDHDHDKIEATGKDQELLTLRFLYKKGKIKVSDEDKNTLRKVSANHALNSKHHAEYWDIEVNIRNFNEEDKNIIHATNMPKRYIAEMACDWSACALYHNEPIFKWFNKVINKYLFFTDNQIEYLEDCLKKIVKSIGKDNISFPGIKYTAQQIPPKDWKKEEIKESLINLLKESSKPKVKFNYTDSELQEVVNLMNFLSEKYSNISNVDWNVNSCRRNENDVQFFAHSNDRVLRVNCYKDMIKGLSEYEVLSDSHISNGSSSTDYIILNKVPLIEGVTNEVDKPIKIVLNANRSKLAKINANEYLKGLPLDENGNAIVERTSESIKNYKEIVLKNAKNNLYTRLTEEDLLIITSFLNIKKEFKNGDESEIPENVRKLLYENRSLFVYFGEIIIPFFIINNIKFYSGKDNIPLNLIPQDFRDANLDNELINSIHIPMKFNNRYYDSEILFNESSKGVSEENIYRSLKISNKFNGGTGTSLFNVFKDVTEDKFKNSTDSDGTLKDFTNTYLFQMFKTYKRMENLRIKSINSSLAWYEGFKLIDIKEEDLNIYGKDLGFKEKEVSYENIPVFLEFISNMKESIADNTFETLPISILIKRKLLEYESNNLNKNFILKEYPMSMAGGMCRIIANRLNNEKDSLRFLEISLSGERYYQYNISIDTKNNVSVYITPVSPQKVETKVVTKTTLTTTEMQHGVLNVDLDKK